MIHASSFLFLLLSRFPLSRTMPAARVCLFAVLFEWWFARARADAQACAR